MPLPGDLWLTRTLAIFTTIFTGLAGDKVAPSIIEAGLSNGIDPANVGRESSHSVFLTSNLIRF